MGEKYIEFSIYNQNNVDSTKILIEFGTGVDQSVKSLLLGAISFLQVCSTCGLSDQCPGHYGKHPIPFPIFKSVFKKQIEFLLKIICPGCSNIRNADINDLLLSIENNNNVITIQHRKTMLKILANNKSYNKQTKSKCSKSFCQLSSSSIQYTKNNNFIYHYNNNNTIVKQVCDLKDLYKYFTQLPQNLLTLLTPINSHAIIDPKNTIYNQYLLIPSNYVRQQNIYNDNVTDSLTSDLNTLSKNIVTGANSKKAQKTFDIIDSNQKANPYTSSGKKLSLAILTNGTHKDSFLRNNINGKRVPGTTRAVIGPGIELKIGEIDIPDSSLEYLTEPIYFNNVTKSFLLKQSQKSDGEKDIILQSYIKHDHTKTNPYTVVNLKDHLKVMAPKNGDIFETKKQSGHYIVYGRQPSLHKTNLQASKIRKLENNNPDKKERTINISTAVTSSFNGDFDGDEMTGKAFYNTTANVEQGLIMNSKKLFKHPITGTAMFGFVQDQIVATNLLLHEKNISKNKAMNILGEYCYFLPEPKKDYYSGRELISYVFPKYFTLKGVFDNGEIIAENILTNMVSSNSYNSIFNGVSQFYGVQLAIKLIDVLKTIIQNYLKNFGLSIKMSDVVPRPELITTTELFVKKHIDQINQNINNLINDLNDEKLYISSYDEISDLKMKNIDKLNKLTQEYMKQMLEKEYNKPDNQFKICNDINYKLTLADTITILCFSGQKTNKNMPKPGINGKTSLYGCQNDISIESSGFVSTPIIKGLTYNQFVTSIKQEALPQIVNVTSGTSQAGYMGKKMIKTASEMIIGYDRFINSNKHIINFNPNFLKISVEDSSRVSIILPSKDLVWYTDIEYIFNNNIKEYIIQKHINKSINVVSELDFYVNIYTEIMVYYYKAKDKKKKYVIDYKKNKKMIYEFCNMIKEKYYFYLNDISYVTYILLLYFDPSGKMFLNNNKNNNKNNINDYLTDELLNIIFNKIIFKLDYSLSPGTMFGYEIANTIQEKFTQQSLSSFHTTTKAGSNVQKGTTEEFKQLIELSKKDKEDIVTCYAYEEEKLELIKNEFEYISLTKICDTIDIVEEIPSEQIVIYRCNVKIPILIQKKIDLYTIYNMFKIFCERSFTIQEYCSFMKQSDDKKFLSVYLHIKFKQTYKNITINYDVLKYHYKASLWDGIHKGKQINTNLFIDSILTTTLNDENEIEEKTLYELKFFVENLHDFKYIKTSDLESIHLPPWLSYSIGGIQYMKINTFKKAIMIINEPHFIHCLKHFFDFRFATNKPSNLKTLYDKTEIIKQANHGSNNIIADAAYENQIDKCHDIYSSLLVSQKPKIGTNYFDFLINPNKFDKLVLNQEYDNTFMGNDEPIVSML